MEVENEIATNDLNKYFDMERRLKSDNDHEKQEAIYDVAAYLQDCKNNVIINTQFLKLAQTFKELPNIHKIELREVIFLLMNK